MLCCERVLVRSLRISTSFSNRVMQAHILVVAVLCCVAPALLVHSSDTTSLATPPPPEGSCCCAHFRTARTAESEDEAADTITSQEPCSDSTLTPPHPSTYTSIHPESEQGGVCGGGMVALAGGTFTMGQDNPPMPQDGEGPARAVTLDPLCMEVHEVSNEQFAHFVQATGYVAEVRD